MERTGRLGSEPGRKSGQKKLEKCVDPRLRGDDGEVLQTVIASMLR